MKKSIAVLGLGKYGMSLVRELNEMGMDVLAVDREESIVREIADYCTEAVCAELSDEKSLKSLGLKEMDIVVVAIGDNLEASIFAVVAAKEQGVPLVLAKSSSERMSSILRKVGADKVIQPEEYAGKRSAVILASNTMLDYFEVDDSICMIEITPLAGWVGKSLIDLNLRSTYRINVVAVKDENDKWILTDPEQPLKESTKLLVVLEQKDLGRIRNE